MAVGRDSDAEGATVCRSLCARQYRFGLRRVGRAIAQHGQQDITAATVSAMKAWL
jgi:hypothetical protein